mmetsp:Transcript_59299/g.132270  ORF Transcript_59299/g.132270 Transcript_59299/m.132270 type:complete len:315 (-) Transcript_59299:20-964(-)
MVSTALNSAVLAGNLEAVATLLRSHRHEPGFVDRPDLAGETALHAAARSGESASHPAAQTLLSARADVNIQNSMGETPLDAAVFWSMRHRLDGEDTKVKRCKRVAKLLHAAGGVRQQTFLNNRHWAKVFTQLQERKGDVEDVDSETSVGSEASTACNTLEAPTAQLSQSPSPKRGEVHVWEGTVRVDSLKPVRSFHGHRFRDGRSLDQLVHELIDGWWPVLTTEFLKLRCCFRGGRLFCKDVRRLWCLKAFQERVRNRQVVLVNVRALSARSKGSKQGSREGLPYPERQRRLARPLPPTHSQHRRAARRGTVDV